MHLTTKDEVNWTSGLGGDSRQTDTHTDSFSVIRIWIPAEALLLVLWKV